MKSDEPGAVALHFAVFVAILQAEGALAERLARGARCYYQDHLRGEPGALFQFVTRIHAGESPEP